MRSSCVAAAALILSLVGRRSGWPLGGQFFNELILVPLYAAHFRHLDFFPVWSSTDGLGLGTPVLLFYQKAFFYVSGVIYILLGGELKPTLVLSVGIFLAIGAYGMRRALEMVTDIRLLQVVGSVGFLFTNYVFTDWLTRGDLPEFSAMMIVPWLLFWCLNLLKNRRVSLLLIPIVPLLVDAHSAIGLISLFTLAAAVITFVATAGLRGLRAIAKRLVVAIAGASVLLAPTLLAELKFADYYDPAHKVTLAGPAGFQRLRRIRVVFLRRCLSLARQQRPPLPTGSDRLCHMDPHRRHPDCRHHLLGRIRPEAGSHGLGTKLSCPIDAVPSGQSLHLHAVTAALLLFRLSDSVPPASNRLPVSDARLHHSTGRHNGRCHRQFHVSRLILHRCSPGSWLSSGFCH